MSSTLILIQQQNESEAAVSQMHLVKAIPIPLCATFMMLTTDLRCLL
jgi:hypothetical protein